MKTIRNHQELLNEVRSLASTNKPRVSALQATADLLRESGGCRWVGLYDVEQPNGIVRNVVWSGPGPPEFPIFLISEGLTSLAISTGKTINVGNVVSDPRYLTAFGSTMSEIIVPVFDAERDVIGTIDIESEKQDAFPIETQEFLEQCAGVIRTLWGG